MVVELHLEFQELVSLQVFFALGALFKNSGLNAMQSFLSTLIGFALPGQLVMAETLIVNGTLLNILIAVFLINARLYPMTVNLVPVIRQKNRPRWHYYFLAHFIAVTSWVYMLSNYNKINKENRFSFFFRAWRNSLGFIYYRDCYWVLYSRYN